VRAARIALGENILYHNLGDGTFEDVTAKAHIDQTNGHYGFSVSTLTMTTTAGRTSMLPVTAPRASSTTTITTARSPMSPLSRALRLMMTAGAGWQWDLPLLDYDGDGRLDLFKTNFFGRHLDLYRNKWGRHV